MTMTDTKPGDRVIPLRHRNAIRSILAEHFGNPIVASMSDDHIHSMVRQIAGHFDPDFARLMLGDVVVIPKTHTAADYGEQVQNLERRQELSDEASKAAFEEVIRRAFYAGFSTASSLSNPMAATLLMSVFMMKGAIDTVNDDLKKQSDADMHQYFEEMISSTRQAVAKSGQTREVVRQVVERYVAHETSGSK